MAKKLSFLLTILSLHVHGQSWKFVETHDLGQKITACDVGSLDKVFLGTERGNVYSFHGDGSKDQEYSSAIFQPVTSLDASNSLRVFVFYKDVSQFEFLERFTAFPRSYQLKDFGIEKADAATTGSSNTIWLLSGDELTCVNPLNHSILFTFSLSEDQEKVIKKLGPDRQKVERMIASSSNSLSGFRNSRLKGEMTYLKAESDEGVTTRTEWPMKEFEFVARAGETFFFAKGEKVSVYRFQE